MFGELCGRAKTPLQNPGDPLVAIAAMCGNFSELVQD
jgi:hypothetical protein